MTEPAKTVKRLLLRDEWSQPAAVSVQDRVWAMLMLLATVLLGRLIHELIMNS